MHPCGRLAPEPPSPCKTSFESDKKPSRCGGLDRLPGYWRVISYHCGVWVRDNSRWLNVLAADYPLTWVSYARKTTERFVHTRVLLRRCVCSSVDGLPVLVECSFRFGAPAVRDCARARVGHSGRRLTRGLCARPWFGWTQSWVTAVVLMAIPVQRLGSKWCTDPLAIAGC